MEHCYVNPAGKASKGQFSIAKDEVVAGLQKVTSIIHRNGSKAIAQINHAGSATSSMVTGEKLFSASAAVNASGEPVEALSGAEIADVIKDSDWAQDAMQTIK